MALAVALFTCIDASAKRLVLSGLPVLQVVFARYAGHFVVAFGVYIRSEGLGALRSNRPGLQLLRSLALLGVAACNSVALRRLPITLTTTIMFAVPVMVTLLAAPMLGEKVGPPLSSRVSAPKGSNAL